MWIFNGIVTKGNSWQPEISMKFFFFTHLQSEYIVTYLKLQLLIHSTWTEINYARNYYHDIICKVNLR